jgi:hypothetical protein
MTSMTTIVAAVDEFSATSPRGPGGNSGHGRLVSLKWLPPIKKFVTESWARNNYGYRMHLNETALATSSPDDEQITAYMKEATDMIDKIVKRSKQALLEKIKSCHAAAAQTNNAGRHPVSVEDVAQAYAGDGFDDIARAELVGGIFVHPSDGWLIKEEKAILTSMGIAGYDGKMAMKRNSERNGCIYKILKQTASDCIKYATRRAWERTLKYYIGTRTSPQLEETHSVNQITGVRFTAYKVTKKGQPDNTGTDSSLKASLISATRAYLESGRSITDVYEVVALAQGAEEGKKTWLTICEH